MYQRWRPHAACLRGSRSVTVNVSTSCTCVTRPCFTLVEYFNVNCQEKTAQKNGISNVLAEEVAFVARIAGNGIVAVQIGAIVVAKLHTVDEP